MQSSGSLIRSPHSSKQKPSQAHHSDNCSSPVTVGADGGQMINEVLAKVQLTEGSVCHQTHPAISPIPECVTGVRSCT